MLEKNTDPLFLFRWQKDADGYDFASDGLSIVRRGGRMVPVDVVAQDPPLHTVFAGLTNQVNGAEDERPLNNAGPFHLRRFPTMSAAILEFVREFGFLGSSTWGANAESEPLDYIEKRSVHLLLFLDVFRAPSVATLGLIAEKINRIAPPMQIQLAAGRQGTYRIVISPQSLAAWMWLRVAQDFQSGINWSGHPCKQCGEIIGRGPGGKRAHAQFCSNQCRTYFNRTKAQSRKGAKK